MSQRLEAILKHPIYYERTSDGMSWPACACGEVQLMSDPRSAQAWIAAHLEWATEQEPSND